jgi:hypothetical protein
MILVPSPGAESLGTGAPAKEIEITSAMIEAGIRVLWESGAVENPMEGADQLLVDKIFVAMFRVAVVRS